MCLICVEFNNGKLTFEEARRNLGEMVDEIDKDHAAKLSQELDAFEKQLTRPWTKRVLQGFDRLGKPLKKDDSK